MDVLIRPMSLDDYPLVVELWRLTDGIGLNESDTKEGIGLFLQRNQEMSAVALAESGQVVGAILCGHDGRRGYLHHLAVAVAYRNQGVGSQVISRCFRRLALEGIQKCNIVVFGANEEGAEFWRHNGWIPRTDLDVYQKPIGSSRSAV